jgi:hypothetical protein
LFHADGSKATRKAALSVIPFAEYGCSEHVEGAKTMLTAADLREKLAWAIAEKTMKLEAPIDVSASAITYAT